tara:strand:- start:173 stop:601 length:429 start_codon:yes stop_codon:yes gene_type:complete
MEANVADIITGMIKQFSSDDRFTFEPASSGKSIKLVVSDTSWFEIEKRENSLLRISFATTDRYMNEDIEHAILDSKDPIDDFVYDGMEEAGEEDEHKVTHFHDGAFRYAIDLNLEDSNLSERAVRVLNGLFFTFEEFVEEAD